MGAPKRFNNETRLVAKMLSKIKRLGEKRSPEESLISIKEMEDHIDKRDAEARVSIDENVMNFGDYYGYENLPDDNDKLLYHLFGVLECNGFSINDSRGITIVGVGVYPTISLLNHSMEPNCVAISMGKSVHVRALKDIAEGEELFISYTNELSTLEESHSILKDTFYFDYNIDLEKEDLREGIQKKDDLLNAFHPGEYTEKSRTYITKYSTDMFKRIDKTRAAENHPRATLQA